MKGKTGSIRQDALSLADFNQAEKHGKREDVMGPARKVRDVPPLVYGSMDLAEARAKHMEGVQQQGKTEAIHAFVQFPTMLKVDEKAEKAMLHHAVKFLNDYHGGDAVFAARLDRDEKGKHGVDVFLLPKYDFHYKDGRTQKRAAVSKFSKEHAQRRHKDLIDPDEDLKDPKSPIVQGRALQAAWFEYLRDDCKLAWVEPPERKKTRSKDRLEPEVYALNEDLKRLKKVKDNFRVKETSLKIRTVELDEREKAIQQREQEARTVVERAKEQAALYAEALRSDAKALGRAIHFPVYEADPTSKEAKEAVKAAQSRKKAQTAPTPPQPQKAVQEPVRVPEKGKQRRGWFR